MMDRDVTSLERFVRAVHRRSVVVRMVESTALGVLWGCAAGAILAGALIWRGEDAWSTVGAALAVGALCGASWGTSRRPSQLAAAMEADRQLRTADLLATAWAFRDASSDPFRDVVLAQAAARSASIAPSQVVLNRMGVRAWGGLALALSFVWTLAAMSSGVLEARTEHSSSAARYVEKTREARDRPVVEIAMDIPRVQPRVDQNPPDSRHAPDLSTAPQTGQAPDPSTTPSATDSNDNTSAGGSSGTGDDAGQTRVRDRERPNNSRSPNEIHDGLATPDDGPAAAGGVGGRARDPRTTTAVSAGTLHDDAGPPTPPPPPWQTPSWPAAVESARWAVRQGGVPDDYRDLVRGYFDADIP